MALQTEFEFNILLLGEANVGKTSLVRLLKQDVNIPTTESPNYQSEIAKEITKHQLRISD